MYSQNRGWMSFRPQEHLIEESATSGDVSHINDGELVDRIISAYHQAVIGRVGDPENFWLSLYGPLKEPIHDALISRNHEETTRLLRDPRSNFLFYGFEALFQGLNENPAWLSLQASSHYDGLLRLCEAVGVIAMEDPEAYRFDQDPPPKKPIESLLLLLDHAFGFRVTFPNPYPHESGLATTRGVASQRAIHSLYLAWRSTTFLTGIANPRILEIGAGLGRTAFYSSQFGIKDYSIIDIPMTLAAQAYFLGRTLGDNRITLCGEAGDALVKLMPPKYFLDSDEKYDLVVNVDSLPEIGEEFGMRYIKEIAHRSPRFLSINHELLPFIVKDGMQQVSCRSSTRHPYWMRRGYLEEVFTF
ncbi:hypothetical protein [Rhodoblastus sp.]|uniref:hypothetical protein n=1 Tax=Rhodoblastus sp. TaxID=1962975 RepID=UPI003F98B3EB